jgi:signal transduction histidine kinase
LTEENRFALLVSLACHDLRTPLATIFGFARTLARSDDLGEPATGYLRMVEASAQQLAELLDDLSVAARIEAGRYDPQLTEAETGSLAQFVAEQLGPERVTAAGDGATVRVDRPATERAVVALTQCALRHGGLDHVTVTAEGAELAIAPITPASAPVVLGEDLRDLGAAVAGSVIEALGGSVELEDETLRVRLAG